MSSEIETIKNVVIRKILASTSPYIAITGPTGPQDINPSYPTCGSSWFVSVPCGGVQYDQAILKNAYVMMSTADQLNDNTLIQLNWSLSEDPVLIFSVVRSNPYPNVIVKIDKYFEGITFNMSMVNPRSGNLASLKTLTWPPTDLFDGKNITLTLCFDFIKFKKHK